jgi:menaquinol-cytochrome c reductase cytochrome b/c subunit
VWLKRAPGLRPRVVEQSGCLACHLIGKQGNNGPGPVLTDVGSQLSRSAITHALIDSTAPMPSFQGLKQQYPIRFRALVTYLGALRNGR